MREATPPGSSEACSRACTAGPTECGSTATHTHTHTQRERGCTVHVRLTQVWNITLHDNKGFHSLLVNLQSAIKHYACKLPAPAVLSHTQ